MIMKYLVRDSSDGICFCECPPEQAIPMVPGTTQMDCPWCGCGYLFSCLTCGLAFTVARVAEVALTPAELVKRQLRAVLEGDTYTLREEEDLLHSLNIALSHISDGDYRYVVLDGRLLRTDHPGASFVGLVGRHSLDEIPHIERPRSTADPLVVKSREKLVEMFERPYWFMTMERKRRTTS